MPMPEAPMNKNGQLMLRENQIRTARKILSIQTEAKTKTVRNTANGKLR